MKHSEVWILNGWVKYTIVAIVHIGTNKNCIVTHSNFVSECRYYKWTPTFQSTSDALEIYGLIEVTKCHCALRCCGCGCDCDDCGYEELYVNDGMTHTIHIRIEFKGMVNWIAWVFMVQTTKSWFVVGWRRASSSLSSRPNQIKWINWQNADSEPTFRRLVSECHQQDDQ